MKQLTKESFLAGAKFEYLNKHLGGNVTIGYRNEGYIDVKSIGSEKVYKIIDTNDFEFFLDMWNNPEAILFVEYSDFVLCENED